MGGDAVDHQQDAGTVITIPEIRDREVAEFAGCCVGQEALGAKSDLGANVSAAVGARFLRHHKEDDARVSRGIARIPLPSHTPLATDLKPDFLDGPSLEIGKRHHDDLAAGLRLHVVDDRRDGGRLVRRDDVREVVDVADRRGELEPRRLSAPSGRRCQRGENEERERADVHGRSLSRSFPGWKAAVGRAARKAPIGGGPACT